MAQTYLVFDFGADEGKVQQARHKLESWRQAFRLDKKLQFKFDRGEGAPAAAPADEKSKGSIPSESKTKSKAKPETKAKAAGTKSAESSAEKNGDVKLFVRLYFSPHEKLSEQRWVKQIPAEEPFKSAGPRVVQENSPEFAEILEQFDSLD